MLQNLRLSVRSNIKFRAQCFLLYQFDCFYIINIFLFLLGTNSEFQAVKSRDRCVAFIQIHFVD